MCYLLQRKGSENHLGFSEWNPQAEFISAEENPEFQGLSAGTLGLFICYASSK